MLANFKFTDVEINASSRRTAIQGWLEFLDLCQNLIQWWKDEGKNKRKKKKGKLDKWKKEWLKLEEKVASHMTYVRELHERHVAATI